MAIPRYGATYFRQGSGARMPPFPMEVDWYHQLAQGLTAFFPLNGNMYDLVGRTPVPSLTASAGFSSGPSGGRLNCPNSGHLTVADASAFKITTSGFTIAALIQIANYSNYQGIATKCASNAGPWQFWINQGTGQPVCIVDASNAGVTATNAIAQNVQVSVSVTISSSVNPVISHYTNGVPNGTGNPTVTINDSTDPTQFAFRADGAVQLNGQLGALAFYNRPLRADEAMWIALEPYAMLRPKIARTITIGRGAGSVASGVVFRRTLSMVGTRAGSRQAM